jgi:hypothetical protein
MEPKKIKEIVTVISAWEDALRKIAPDGEFSSGNQVKEGELFTFEIIDREDARCRLDLELKFMKDGTVEIYTLHGTHIESLNSYEKAEEWILNQFKIQDLPKEPKTLLSNLPSLEDRREKLEKWLQFLSLLEPYGVDVFTESESRPIELWLPTMESILGNDGKPDYRDESVFLDQGGDWQKVILEEVIPELKKIYDLSSTDLPNIDLIKDLLEKNK